MRVLHSLMRPASPAGKLGLLMATQPGLLKAPQGTQPSEFHSSTHCSNACPLPSALQPRFTLFTSRVKNSSHLRRAALFDLKRHALYFSKRMASFLPVERSSLPHEALSTLPSRQTALSFRRAALSHSQHSPLHLTRTTRAHPSLDSLAQHFLT